MKLGIASVVSKYSGRTLIALAVAGVALGIVSAVQADIPDNGVIFGCYGKPGTSYKGNLRVRDADQGEQCRYYENPISWNETGPQGATGPTGPAGPSGAAGPTALFRGSANAVPASPGVVLISHSVTPGEAGLTILTSPFSVDDNDGTIGGTTKVNCSLLINGSGFGYVVVVHDNGNATAGDTASMTNITRQVLAAGDVITVSCRTVPSSDGGEAFASAVLLLEHVGS
jgi:hypothetical protein